MISANRERNKEQNLMQKELASLLGVSYNFLTKGLADKTSTTQKPLILDMISLD